MGCTESFFALWSLGKGISWLSYHYPFFNLILDAQVERFYYCTRSALYRHKHSNMNYCLNISVSVDMNILIFFSRVDEDENIQILQFLLNPRLLQNELVVYIINPPNN